MPDYDFIIISQAEVVDYQRYSRLPLERIELYQDLIYPRMVYHQGRFYSHLDFLNSLRDNISFSQATQVQQRRMLNIWNLPAFSGLHLANYLRPFGIRTKIINNFDAEWDLFCRAYRSCRRKPLVGISTTFMLSWRTIKRIVQELRGFDPAMEIVLGGAFVNEQYNSEGEQSLCGPLEKYGVDYIVHSFNSEVDLRDLIRARQGEGNLADVNNLLYRSGATGRIHQTESQWHEPLLDEIQPLWNTLAADGIHHTVQMRTSSGCPFACAFCSYPQTARGFHLMAVERVEEHIRSLLRIPGLTRIIFIDDTFNVPVERFQQLCRMFCKYEFEWFSFLRVQYIDEPTAALMRQSGCKGVYLGIESADDDILRNMNKKATRADFARGISYLKKYRIPVMAAFVIGFPGETERSIQNNIDFIEQQGLDFYTLKEFYYIRNTPIDKDREKYDLVGQGSDWQHRTMDYQTAHRMKMEMFRTIQNSVFVDPDTNLWYLAYLYDQGFGMFTIGEMQKIINRIMIGQMNGNFTDQEQNLYQLRTVLNGPTVYV